MTQLRIAEAAALAGVSDDTMRRWIEGQQLTVSLDSSGKQVVSGAELVDLLVSKQAPAADSLDPGSGHRSARNSFTGLVTKVTSDKVMSQVELQCGPFRVVSLMSTEAVRELGLEPGSIAVAVVKATTVIVEAPSKN